MPEFIIPRTSDGNEIRKFYLKVAGKLNEFIANVVYGPSAVTDGRVAVFDGTDGKLLKQGTRLETSLVAGPSSATDNAVARFDGTGGKTLQNSGVTIDDSGNLILPADIYRVAWQSYTATYEGFDPSTPDNWASTYAVIIGKMVWLWFNFNGNSNQNYMRLSLPVNAAAFDVVATCQGLDAGAYETTPTYAWIKSTDATKLYFCADTLSGDASWTNSGDKGAIGQIWYRAA